MRSHTSESPYKYALSVGLLIVQDKRPGCVRVKRAGFWVPATEIETFAYYDFLLRYPRHFHNYQSENREIKRATEMTSGNVREAIRKSITDSWETVPAHMNASADLALTVNRKLGIYYIGNFDDFGRNMSQISDWAWRTRS